MENIELDETPAGFDPTHRTTTTLISVNRRQVQPATRESGGSIMERKQSRVDALPLKQPRGIGSELARHPRPG
jgi:hypothetical protein